MQICSGKPTNSSEKYSFDISTVSKQTICFRLFYVLKLQTLALSGCSDFVEFSGFLNCVCKYFHHGLLADKKVQTTILRNQITIIGHLLSKSKIFSLTC